MAAVIKIEVTTSGGLDDVKRDVEDLGKTAEKSGGGFSAMQEIATGALRQIGEGLVGLAVKGFGALTDAISDGIADAKQNAQIQAQTAQVIKSTGEAAGVSAQHVADYASSLSDAAGKSLFGDDQIQQSTNLLLTFTEIKGATLDAATAISVDMAQALGGAPKDAAIQLGKALNDPVKGITALTRVGVTFSEEQKAQIQAMQEAGDTAGAQAVILAELNKEFGGSAEAAAAATGGWSEFNGRMGEAKEALGAAVLPLLNMLASVLTTNVLPVIESAAAALGPFIETLTQSFDEGGIVGLLNNIIFSLTGVTGALNPVADIIDSIIASFANTSPLDTFTAASAALGAFWSTTLQPALTAVWTVLQTQVWPILSDLGTALFPLVGAAIQVLSGLWSDVLQPALMNAWTLLTTVILPVLAALAGWLRDNLPGAIQATADFLTNTLFPILHSVYDFIAVNVIPILQVVAQWLIANVPLAIQAASDFFNNTLLPALNAIWQFIENSILPIFATVYQWLQVTIPAGVQTLANFWNTILLPALNAIWAFIQNFLVPLFTALVNVHMAILGAAVRTLAGVWNTVLLPALNAIWAFITTYLGPIFTWLDVNVIQPLLQTLKNTAFFVIGALIPFMENLAKVISGTVQAAFGTLASVAGDARGALKSIGEAVQSVINWLNDLADAISNISIPDWLEGHSPPPMANWFSHIGEAVGAVNAQLPTLAMNLAAQLGPSGQSIANTTSTRSFTYAPQISTTGNVSAPMDLALASSLAGV